ncbi:unnamed protein product [Cunninghamella blakesleeana]
MSRDSIQSYNQIHVKIYEVLKEYAPEIIMPYAKIDNENAKFIADYELQIDTKGNVYDKFGNKRVLSNEEELLTCATTYLNENNPTEKYNVLIFNGMNTRYITGTDGKVYSNYIMEFTKPYLVDEYLQLPLRIKNETKKN